MNYLQVISQTGASNVGAGIDHKVISGFRTKKRKDASEQRPSLAGSAICLSRSKHVSNITERELSLSPTICSFTHCMDSHFPAIL